MFPGTYIGKGIQFLFMGGNMNLLTNTSIADHIVVKETILLTRQLIQESKAPTNKKIVSTNCICAHCYTKVWKFFIPITHSAFSNNSVEVNQH